VNVYKELYKIEKEIKGETIAERYSRRQKDSIPLLDKFFDLCRVYGGLKVQRAAVKKYPFHP